MSGERDLATLLAGARPVLVHPAVVLVSVADPAGLPALATVVEDEGVTVVLLREDAERLGLDFDWVGAWITLRVHSALESVGLTAAFSTALAFFDGFRTERLPANLLQAQRDYFGAHTYERLDKPRGEFFHTNWTGRGGDVSSSTYNA